MHGGSPRPALCPHHDAYLPPRGGWRSGRGGRGRAGAAANPHPHRARTPRTSPPAAGGEPARGGPDRTDARWQSALAGTARANLGTRQRGRLSSPTRGGGGADRQPDITPAAPPGPGQPGFAWVGRPGGARPWRRHAGAGAERIRRHPGLDHRRATTTCRVHRAAPTGWRILGDQRPHPCLHRPGAVERPQPAATHRRHHRTRIRAGRCRSGGRACRRPAVHRSAPSAAVASAGHGHGAAGAAGGLGRAHRRAHR